MPGRKYTQEEIAEKVRGARERMDEYPTTHPVDRATALSNHIKLSGITRATWARWWQEVNGEPLPGVRGRRKNVSDVPAAPKNRKPEPAKRVVAESATAHPCSVLDSALRVGQLADDLIDAVSDLKNRIGRIGKEFA
jgi:hypothetical protein